LSHFFVKKRSKKLTRRQNVLKCSNFDKAPKIERVKKLEEKL